MELWGAALYGDPCRECGFDWAITAPQAITAVVQSPAAFEQALTDGPPDARVPQLGWSAAGYVRHVADNLEMSSYRLNQARLDGCLTIPGYDADLLAAARGYATATRAASLLALRRSAQAWAEDARAAVAAGVVVQHATRGPQAADEMVRSNAHDALHHLHDVRRIVAAARAVDGSAAPTPSTTEPVILLGAPLPGEFAALYDATGWADAALDPALADAALRASWRVAVARLDGRLVGVGRVIGDGVLHAFVTELIVAPEMRGAGIGRSLLDTLVRECLAHGVTAIQLFAAQGRLDFYRRAGFEAREDDSPGMQWAGRVTPVAPSA